jgi:hypothetical protein
MRETLAAIVLALLYQATVGTREMVAYLTTMVAAGVAVLVAIIFVALQLQQPSASRNARTRVERV